MFISIQTLSYCVPLESLPADAPANDDEGIERKRLSIPHPRLRLSTFGCLL